MPTKIKELDNTRDGDRNSCPICKPANKAKFVSANKVWAFAKANPNVKVFK